MVFYNNSALGNGSNGYFFGANLSTVQTFRNNLNDNNGLWGDEITKKWPLDSASGRVGRRGKLLRGPTIGSQTVQIADKNFIANDSKMSPRFDFGYILRVEQFKLLRVRLNEI